MASPPQSPSQLSTSTSSTEKQDDDVGESQTGAALSAEDYLKEGKVVIFFKGAGNVPQMKLKKFKFATTTKFQGIIDWLRKQLHLTATDPLFVFVNGSFQPSPDETLGELFRCFHQGPKLVVNYSNVVAWG
eukprot:TRINITY_DN7746_c0_g1_i1.p1 TRINITY_DN7746_c0_g1~~TRINITY_DN7746_c0_g1_i1.p1  ORF type:complete len:131 (-),score=31.64 TRINITY_DN7746_c0_g1_i1:85-477(-)